MRYRNRWALRWCSGALRDTVVVVAAAAVCSGCVNEFADTVCVLLQWYILLPQSWFISKFWMPLSSLLILWVLAVVPVDVAFNSMATTEWNIVSRIVDSLFMLDCVLGFITAYEDKQR